MRYPGGGLSDPAPALAGATLGFVGESSLRVATRVLLATTETSLASCA